MIKPLPKCAVLTCTNEADPRWFAHGVMICDGHDPKPQAKEVSVQPPANILEMQAELVRLRAEVARLRELVAKSSESVQSASIFYMHDNHTFTKLVGDIDAVVAAARQIALESPYGMLGAATLLNSAEKQVRRAGDGIHARTEGLSESDLAAWRAAVMADPDAARLLAPKAKGPS